MKKIFQNFKNEKNKITMDTPLAHTYLAKELVNILLKNKVQKKTLIFLCIGTDRSTGDSLGPIVGSRLNNILPSSAKVFGTLPNPIHAVNLKDNLIYIKKNIARPYIVAIDASLGKNKDVGNINIREEPLKPGTGVNKSLPEVGHCHITGTVNIGGFMEFMVLQNTRLNTVIKLSHIISKGVFLAVNHVYSNQRTVKK